MSPQTLANRVEILEITVVDLGKLPDRVGALELRVGALESQVSQLRTEMRIEFSAVRVEMRELNTGVRQEMHELNDGLRQDVHRLNEETRRELGGRIEDLGTHMRVLHEEVISRIALLDEHMNGRRSTRHARARQSPRKRKLKD